MAQLGVDQMFNDAVAKIEARYNSERDKRLAERPQGEAQFLDTTTSEKWKYLSEDIWIDPSEHTSIPSTIDISKPVKYLITGTGFTSLIFAVRLMQITGAKPEDFLMLDPSGGYGGVWYWNRYPGLMCDVSDLCCTNILLPSLS